MGFDPLALYDDIDDNDLSSYAPKSPLPPVVTQDPPGGSGAWHPPMTPPPQSTAAPATSTTPAGGGMDDPLMQYFLKQQQGQKEQLAGAQDASKNNLLYARLGGAANTIGSGLAGAKTDSQPFEALAKDAELPVANIEQEQKLTDPTNRLVADYMSKKYKLGQEAEQGALNRASREGIAENRTAAIKSLGGTKMDFRDKQLHERTHTRLLDKLDRDPTLKTQFQQIRNLDNAATLVQNSVNAGKPITKQQFNDFQQSVVANLGIRGQQAMHERDAKYFDSLGLNGDLFLQFVTGKPQDIGKDNPLYKHVKDMANWEAENVKGQIQAQVDGLIAGNEYIYDENPKLKAGLDAKVAAIMKKTGTKNLEGGGASAKATTSGPKAGDVIKGYRFKGGDPSKKESWEKA